VPAALFGWLIAGWVADSILIVGYWFCPAEFIASNHCFAPWMDFLFQCTLFTGALMAAGLFVILPSVVAPSRKPIVAIVAFLVGLVIAINLALELREWGLFSVAIAAGLLAVWIVAKRNGVDKDRSIPA